MPFEYREWILGIRLYEMTLQKAADEETFKQTKKRRYKMKFQPNICSTWKGTQRQKQKLWTKLLWKMIADQYHSLFYCVLLLFSLLCRYPGPFSFLTQQSLVYLTNAMRMILWLLFFFCDWHRKNKSNVGINSVATGRRSLLSQIYIQLDRPPSILVMVDLGSVIFDYSCCFFFLFQNNLRWNTYNNGSLRP